MSCLHVLLVIACSLLLAIVHVNCLHGGRELSEILQCDWLAANNTYGDGFCFEHAIAYDLQTHYNDNRTVEGLCNAILVELDETKDYYEHFILLMVT